MNAKVVINTRKYFPSPSLAAIDAFGGKRVRSIFLACLPFLGNKGPNEESPFEDKWDNGSIYPICEHWLRKIDPPFLSPMRIHSTRQPDHAEGGKGVLTK